MIELVVGGTYLVRVGVQLAVAEFALEGHEAHAGEVVAAILGLLVTRSVVVAPSLHLAEVEVVEGGEDAVEELLGLPEVAELLLSRRLSWGLLVAVLVGVVVLARTAVVVLALLQLGTVRSNVVGATTLEADDWSASLSVPPPLVSMGELPS